MVKLVIVLLYFEQVKDCFVQREKRFDSYCDLFAFISKPSPFFFGMLGKTINDVRIEWTYESVED